MTDPPSPDLIAVACWCERTTLHIPVQWVSEAKTDSCGPLCGPGCPAQGADAFDDDNEVATIGKKTKMNRFDPQSYDPATDSSFGYHGTKVRREFPAGLILEVVGGIRLCACGCGETPNGKKAAFRMGHDSRLRGKLARALASGAAVVITDEHKRIASTTTPTEYAGRFSTDKLDWAAAVTQAAERAKATPNARSERLGPRIGEVASIQIGRWMKDATVAAVSEVRAFEVLYEYLDAKGAVRQVRRDVYGQLREIKPGEPALAS